MVPLSRRRNKKVLLYSVGLFYSTPEEFLNQSPSRMSGDSVYTPCMKKLVFTPEQFQFEHLTHEEISVQISYPWRFPL